MILFPGRHLMGVLECHELTLPNNMVELKTHKLCVKNQVEFMVQLVGTTQWTTNNTCKPQLAGLGFHVLTRRQTSFGPGFMSWHWGKLPYPCTFAFGFLLSVTSFYFLRSFAAFCKGILIFLKGFSIFLDGFPLPEKSEKIHLRQQVYERLLFELCNSSPLCSPSFINATCSPSVIIATMPTSHPTKAIRMSRCKFGGINISLPNFTPMKNISHM